MVFFAAVHPILLAILVGHQSPAGRVGTGHSISFRGKGPVALEDRFTSSIITGHSERSLNSSGVHVKTRTGTMMASTR